VGPRAKWGRLTHNCVYIPCVVWVGALECLLAIMDYGTGNNYELFICINYII